MAASGSRAPSSRLVVDGGVIEAHTLPGDQLLAGPVLLDHRAVWVEAGHRLLVRSLDAQGRTRTLFSTAKTPGAPKNVVWPFWVESVAAGDGRVAFVEDVIPCASAPPPHLHRCADRTEGPPTDSITLFAGRPGAIRPVESLVHPSRHCRQRHLEPATVAVSDIGLVDSEITPYPCRPGASRLVLRSFSGRLERVLARNLPFDSGLVTAGGLAALVRSFESGAPDQMKIVRLDTGRTLLRLSRRCQRWIAAMAIDGSGSFAVTMALGPHSSFCRQWRGNAVKIGQIGHARLRTVATDVLTGDQTASIAIADGYVAYGRQIGHARTATQVMVGPPGRTPTPIPGMRFGNLAFDGQVVASAHEDSVQLAVLRKS